MVLSQLTNAIRQEPPKDIYANKKKELFFFIYDI